MIPHFYAQVLISYLQPKEIQEDLDILADRTRKTALTINVKNIKYMIISTTHKAYVDLNLSLNGEPEVTNTSASFWMKNLVNHVATIVNNKTCSLRRLGHSLPQKTIIMLYKSLILPHFNYAAMIRGSASNS